MDDATYRLTTIDGLTGVHNKRFFLEFLEREMASCQRHGRPLSLLLFDIDHLTQINEEHGLIPGDVVLKEVARRVSGRMRQADLLARFGGEEFAVVLPETSRPGAQELAEQIRKLVADDPVTHEGQ